MAGIPLTLETLQIMCEGFVKDMFDGKPNKADFYHQLHDRLRIIIQQLQKIDLEFMLLHTCWKNQIQPKDLKNRPYTPFELEQLLLKATEKVNLLLKLMQANPKDVSMEMIELLRRIHYNDYITIGFKPDEIIDTFETMAHIPMPVDKEVYDD